MSSVLTHQDMPAFRPERVPAAPSDGLAASRTSANADLFAETQAATVLDAWSRRAAASSGFGDVSAADDAVAAPGGGSVGAEGGLPVARAPAQSGVAGIVDLIAVGAAALADMLRGVLHHWLARQRVAATVRELDQLSDHTLRDIGLNRSEIFSAALECERALRDHSVRRYAHRTV